MRNGSTDQHRRVLIAHPFPLVVDALAAIVGDLGFAVVARATDGAAASASLRDRRPDVAILGLGLQPVGGLELLREARATRAETRIVLLASALDSGPLLAAVELGVQGLMLATAPASTVADCLAAVASGQQWLDPTAMKLVLERVTHQAAEPVPTLTRRERDVARLVAAGQRNRTIAEALGISEGTVKMHLHNVYAKLGLESRTQLAMDARSWAA